MGDTREEHAHGNSAVGMPPSRRNLTRHQQEPKSTYG
jgi:hypothetical protein